MECQCILVFMVLLLDCVLSQYTCSNRPDGQCTPCDCKPDCFDLSDETNCTNGTRIHDVLLPHYWNIKQQTDVDRGTGLRFFPPPPLPPFRLCQDTPSTSTPYTSTASSSHASTSSAPTSHTSKITVPPIPPTKPTPFTTQTPTRQPRYETTTPEVVTVPTRMYTTVPPTRGWQTTTSTFSRWLCSAFIREYYSRCGILFPDYCRYLIRALQMCVRENTLTTTTTTRPPPTFPPFTLAPFDYYNFDYIFV